MKQALRIAKGMPRVPATPHSCFAQRGCYYHDDGIVLDDFSVCSRLGLAQHDDAADPRCAKTLT
eukprot:3260585-Rhodomonas_salina.2